MGIEDERYGTFFVEYWRFYLLISADILRFVYRGVDPPAPGRWLSQSSDTEEMKTKGGRGATLHLCTALPRKPWTNQTTIQQFLFPYRAFRGSPVFPAILQAMDETTLGFRGAVLANLMAPPLLRRPSPRQSFDNGTTSRPFFARQEALSALPLSCKRWMNRSGFR